jgi:hypothetical protein
VYLKVVVTDDGEYLHQLTTDKTDIALSPVTVDSTRVKLSVMVELLYLEPSSWMTPLIRSVFSLL